MPSPDASLIGRTVEWQKSGRGHLERQRGVVVAAVDRGTTGREVYGSIRELVLAANRRLLRAGRPLLDVDPATLKVARRHISFALDTTRTDRVLVMSEHESGDPTKRRWFCPSSGRIARETGWR